MSVDTVSNIFYNQYMIFVIFSEENIGYRCKFRTWVNKVRYSLEYYNMFTDRLAGSYWITRLPGRLSKSCGTWELVRVIRSRPQLRRTQDLGDDLTPGPKSSSTTSPSLLAPRRLHKYIITLLATIGVTTLWPNPNMGWPPYAQPM